MFVKLNMKTILQHLLSICAISLLAIKTNAQHQIGVQSSAFYYFFDKTPIQTDAADGFSKFSYGLQYQYQKSSKKLISAQYNHLLDANDWSNDALTEKYRNYRNMQELNVVFSNQNQLHHKLNWTYGVGPTLRKEWFALDTMAVPVTNSIPYNIYSSNQLQLGLKGQLSLIYTPIKWLSIYSQFQFSGYLLNRQINENYNDQLISDFGFKQHINFPSRFYSSLTFGVGINF